MDQLANWWDGAELWVAGLPFIPQVVLVIVVMIPACFGIAWALDRVLSALFAAVGRPDPADSDVRVDAHTKVEGS
ncbi:hypothetical protein AB4Z09_10005 [Rhodococcus sp. TAF43]|uniref:hypothetical protein n=1 Tax=unclassified Rhodococcus (in: high G+C Gram-positive bacteria) TaxID=192944 RepID=UPI0015815815|nr:hypothetical protein [Rhodococcus sp. W8901]QKT12212.1 hypothetical protein HUN07_17185 [Rhodococcus sp. W8901]